MSTALVSPSKYLTYTANQRMSAAHCVAVSFEGYVAKNIPISINPA
jgi:hypothetical protein